MSNSNTREQLAAYAHEAWAGWMAYMFGRSTLNTNGTITIPAELVVRWSRQMNTPYSELPELEKASDRTEADKMMAIMRQECDCG